MAIVYIHHFPDGKYYVGITDRKKPNDRWANGHGYDCQRKVANAIKEFGWENIEHYYFYVPDIQTAREIEGYLIFKFDSVKNGYNTSHANDSFRSEAFDMYPIDLLPEEYQNQRMTQYCEDILSGMKEKCDNMNSEIIFLKSIIRCKDIQISELKKQKTPFARRLLQFLYR